MTHDTTTNARVLHSTLNKLRELKEAYGFKTLFETAEFVVNKDYASPSMTQLLANRKEQEELLLALRG